jgi:uncharacterized protein (TIGR03083 family)
MNLPVSPANTAPFFPRLYARHVAVLQALTPDQWNLPTVCEGWSVKDVALHMLGDDVGWLSGRRDQHRERATIASWEWNDLIAFINARNDQWVRANRRMSARVLCDLVPIFGSMVCDFVDSLDPNAPGMVINWAGDDQKPIWFEVGRELTERWMHHQHICDAVGITDSLKEPDVLHAVLDMFARALPHAYRGVDLPDGTAITLWLIGEGGGSWTVARRIDHWELFANTDMPPLCTISLPTDTAWRLFTKGISGDAARREAIIEGDARLAEPLLHMVSILA